MTRRSITRTAFFILLVFLCCAQCIQKCKAQSDQRKTENGVIAIVTGWVYIKSDTTVLALQILHADTCRFDIVLKVLSSDGIGYLAVDQYGITYHYKVNEGKRSRVKRYLFIK